MLLCGAALLTCGRLTLAFAYTVPVLLLGELLVVSGAATTFTISSSLLSQFVPPDQVGTTMGMAAAIESACVSTFYECFWSMFGRVNPTSRGCP